MIIRQDKVYEQNSGYPNTNFTEHEGVLIVDETTVDGKALADKVIQCSPYMDFIIENGQLIDVAPTERPPKPPEPIPPVTLEERVTLQQEAIDFILMNF